MNLSLLENRNHKSSLPFIRHPAPHIEDNMATIDTSTPWVERYRPKSLKDVSHQTEVVATLENAVRTGRLPHLLFYGPPGSGKTSVALALCRQLWHPSEWKRRVLELNASDERGISVVREKIKSFAAFSVGSGSSTAGKSFFTKKTEGCQAPDNKEYPNPPYKIIILDEADTVTKDAQAALRRIIEANSRITRFILICNYVTRIIEPLASRCAKFRFQLLPTDSMKERLATIAKAENCSLSDTQLDCILEVSEGDMRRAVQTLQSVHALTVGGKHKAALTEGDIAELVGLPPAKVVDHLVHALVESKGMMKNVQAAVENICLDGYSAQTLLGCLLERFVNMPQLDEMGRAKLAIRIAEAEHCMLDGADEYLQLLTVCGLAMQCIKLASKKLAGN